MNAIVPLGQRSATADARVYRGGIVSDEVDYIVQEKTNFNGRVITFDRDVDTCLALLPESMLCEHLVRNIKTENHAMVS